MEIRVVLEFRTDEFSVERSAKIKEQLLEIISKDAEENKTNICVLRNFITRI